jgi:hypothetical protein
MTPFVVFLNTRRPADQAGAYKHDTTAGGKKQGASFSRQQFSF